MYSGPSAWILFLIWWALSRICEEWRPLQQKRLKLASLYLAGGLFAAWLLAYLFIPSIHLQRLNEEEFAAIRESAEDVLVEIPPGLDIVLPAHYERTLMEVFWGEFKTRSSHMPWVAQKMVSLAVTESLQGSLPEKILKPGFKPIDLFYATNSRTGRPVLDIFGIVHKGDWDWITHPLFGKCRKVDHLAFCHSPEFGVFDNSDYPYVYHLGLGWIYASHPDQSLAVLMEHGNRECRFSESTFPVLDIPGEPPLLYEPRIGFQPKVVPVSP